MTAGCADQGSLLVRVAVVIGVISILRIVALQANATDLFFDESQYWSWSREPAFGYYSKPPLIAWIIAGATGLCGDGEFCIRLPSVLMHAATALVVYFTGRTLYSEKVGFWSAVAYATLPGVSVSSGIISTDVPLLLAWAVALLAFVKLIEAPSAALAMLLGLALGAGLNAKYAMAYFLVGATLAFSIAPKSRVLLKSWHLWGALAGGLVLIAPNIAWNASHSFATLAHTADNAKWEGQLLNPAKGLEFLGAQFGVFGPILFATLLALIWRWARGRARLEDSDRLLIAFSLPVIAIVTGQAFLSRAHPNWAAVAYVPAVILVIGYMLREGERGWHRGSHAINGAIAVLLAVATWQAGQFTVPGAGDPFARTLGNRELAHETVRLLGDARGRGEPYAGVLSDEREITAGLLYYARFEPTPIFAWRSGPRPRDHFELVRPFPPGMSGRVLLVSRKADPDAVTGAFRTVRPLGARSLAAGQSTRTIHFFELSGERPR